MAYTKKEVGEESEVRPEEKVENNNDTQSEIATLKAQIAMLTQMLMQQQGAKVGLSNEEMTLVHLVQCFEGLKTHIELSTRQIDLVAFGETRTLYRREAEELAGKYRSFFERGVIAFGSDGDEMAKRFGLDKFNTNKLLGSDFPNRLGMMDLSQLEDIFTKVGQAQKQFIVEYFKRKIRENDPHFNDISKIELLDRLTRADGDDHGAMEGVLMDRQKKSKK